MWDGGHATRARRASKGPVRPLIMTFPDISACRLGRSSDSNRLPIANFPLAREPLKKIVRVVIRFVVRFVAPFMVRCDVFLPFWLGAPLAGACEGEALATTR